MHMKQLKMLFQVIQISSLNKGVLNSYQFLYITLTLLLYAYFQKITTIVTKLLRFQKQIE